MKHILFLFSFFLILETKAQENLYAIQLCNMAQKETFPEWCKEQHIELVAMIQENFAVVRLHDNDENRISQFCFYTKIAQLNHQIAFYTNTILVKVKPNRTADFEHDFKVQLNYSKHPFIPNMYEVKTAAKNVEEVQLIFTKINIKSYVENASINQIFTLQSTSYDTYYNRQWAIENTGSAIQGSGTANADMQVDSAWQFNTGSYHTKIAILDCGVDTLHEDLVDNILPGFDGFADSVQNTYGYPTPNYSSDGHGTACAGIAAAVADNNIGIAGISYNSQIIPIRIFYYVNYGTTIGIQPTTSTNALVGGSAWAWRIAGADIMSTSAGLSDLYISALSINTSLVNDEINAAFNQARNGKGIAMFFSAGNDDTLGVLWPASLGNTIAVGASDMCDKRKSPTDCSGENWGSTYGQNLDIVAPGVRIVTTDITGNKGFANGAYYYLFNGTSAACPNAAGVGALILSLNPGLHARDVRAIINKTAHKVSGYNYDSTTVCGTWNIEVGHGRVDAYAALQMAVTYQSTVGITEKQADKNSSSIYPNPSSGKVMLYNESNTSQQILITNTIGQSIATITLLPMERQSISLPSGFYLVKESWDGSVERLVVR